MAKFDSDEFSFFGEFLLASAEVENGGDVDVNTYRDALNSAVRLFCIFSGKRRINIFNVCVSSCTIKVVFGHNNTN